MTSELFEEERKLYERFTGKKAIMGKHVGDNVMEALRGNLQTEFDEFITEIGKIKAREFTWGSEFTQRMYRNALKAKQALIDTKETKGGKE